MSKLFFSITFLAILLATAFLYFMPHTATAQKHIQDQEYLYPTNDIFDYFEPHDSRELSNGFSQDECAIMEVAAKKAYNAHAKKRSEGYFSDSKPTGKDNRIGKKWFVRYKDCWPNLKEADGGSVIRIALHTKEQIEKDKEAGEIVIGGGGINFYALFDAKGNLTMWGYD